MTFAAYLRRWKSYTEAGFSLRQYIVQMPPELETTHQVYAWLREVGASRQVLATAAGAGHDYRDMVRTRAKKG